MTTHQNPIIEAFTEARESGATIHDLFEDLSGYQIGYPGADAIQSAIDDATEEQIAEATAFARDRHADSRDIALDQIDRWFSTPSEQLGRTPNLRIAQRGHLVTSSPELQGGDVEPPHVITSHPDRLPTTFGLGFFPSRAILEAFGYRSDLPPIHASEQDVALSRLPIWISDDKNVIDSRQAQVQEDAMGAAIRSSYANSGKRRSSDSAESLAKTHVPVGLFDRFTEHPGAPLPDIDYPGGKITVEGRLGYPARVDMTPFDDDADIATTIADIRQRERTQLGPKTVVGGTDMSDLLARLSGCHISAYLVDGNGNLETISVGNPVVCAPEAVVFSGIENANEAARWEIAHLASGVGVIGIHLSGRR